MVVVGLSVRTLFDALLEETRPRVVAMSAVTIEDMASLAGSHAAVTPIDLDLETLVPSETPPPSDMLVAAWLFGRRPTDVSRLASSTRLLVEDCAQAFDGRLSLSPGADVALYSFGPIKTATALGGAVALFRDRDLARRVQARLLALQPLSDGWFIRRVAKYAMLKLFSGRTLYGAMFALIMAAGRDPDALVGGLARGFAGREDLRARIRRAPPPRLLALLERRLRYWTPSPTAEAAVAWAARGLNAPGGDAPGRWWVLPVLHDAPDKLIAGLRCRGYDATRGATSLRVIGAADTSPLAHRLLSSIVYLPKPGSPAEARRLVKVVSRLMSHQ